MLLWLVSRYGSEDAAKTSSMICVRACNKVYIGLVKTQAAK